MDVVDGGNDRRPSTEEWDGKRASEYVCPKCLQHFVSGEFWIQCDACRDWFHGSCVSVLEHESVEIEKYFCRDCNRTHGPSIMKPVTNDHRHDRTEEHPDQRLTQAGSPKFLSWLQNRHFPPLPQHLVNHVSDGTCLTPQSLVQQGFRVPILIDRPNGLNLRLPHSDMSISEILRYFPPRHQLDVIDSRRQLTFKLPAEDFVRLFNRQVGDGDQVYNCISLEVSQSELGRQVHPPSLVSSMSWVHNNWPKDVPDKPFVSKYCLMSMSGSYTDFHIDFGGTSVWYHVLRGQKVFYLIEPTDDHLNRYEEWMQLKNQSEVFLGDLIPGHKCFRLTLTAGNTLLIPTAWIHAVLTPADSLVFGGNFLHSLNIQLQIRIHEMEQRIKTPAKFQFPFFELAHWYSVPTTVALLRTWCTGDDVTPPDHLLAGAQVLLSTLKQWAEAESVPNEASGGAKKSLVPDGFNCRRALKDLSKALKHTSRQKDSHKHTHESVATETVIGSTSDMSSDCENGELVIVDEGAIEGIRRKVHEDQRKGVIKLKLSLCGKSGLPEVTHVDAAQDPEIRCNKRKRRSTSIEDDPEIMDMIRDQPEDDDFIYLDVETAADDEDVGPVTPDHAWCPRAKVVITGSRKEGRPVRENARREFVETCLANAAAKMEQVMSEKKVVAAARRKSRSNSGGPSAGKQRSSADDMRSSSPSSDVRPNSLRVPKVEKSERKTSPAPRPRKGEKTAKQRLAKLMKIGKRPF